MRGLIFFLAGCATPSAAVLPPSGCIEYVRRGKHLHLTKNGVEIPRDWMAATEGNPEAQKWAARASNEETAAAVFLAAIPVLFISAVATAIGAPDNQATHTAIPILLGTEAASIGITISLVLAAGVHQQAALDRYNRDAGCR
jgi:hypothetical protein